MLSQIYTMMWIMMVQTLIMAFMVMHPDKMPILFALWLVGAACFWYQFHKAVKGKK